MEVLTPAEMYRADAHAIAAGISEEALIARAGLAAAQEIVRRYGARRTVVMCGPGNNGKDGAVVAAHLKAWGWPVSISLDVSGAELIVDALYGAGLNRDFDAGVAAAVNGAGVPVVAIDVPSGLDGLTGRPRGASIKADVTITFFRKKPAHLLYPGRALCGEIVVADIGIPAESLAAIAPRLWENACPPQRTLEAGTHKHRRGHALVWSGAQLSTGATRLSAQAAARSGSGLVTIVGSERALNVHASHLSSIMLRSAETPEALAGILADPRIGAFCIGPAAGHGGATRGFVMAGFATHAAMVLDADALTSFESEPETLFAAIRARSADVVMTPHEGEFKRLFKMINLDSQDKVEAAREAARLSGAVVLFKGPDTVVAHPDGRAVINSNGSGRLATAGSGDVLAGVIAGLLAQGQDGFAAACGGAWLHADAAARCGRSSPVAEDIVAALGA
ncbi:MAG: NAD(P)H-hydrate dehydratase [Proteobacteria bacterium]|nr:NAD(P)H-hydrate dehydratase [Pseudomonadota bacterium]